MRILVADDEELLAEFLEQSLQLDKHVVDIARSGEEMVTKATNYGYDMIIADVMMPKTNGIEACRQLRYAGNQTPLIMLTSKTEERARIAGLDAGADDYMTKPFSFKELNARIRAVARRPVIIQDELLSVGDLVLDQMKKTISLKNELLELRPKEYLVLEHLMRNAGKVVSKKEILESVWQIPAARASNRLEVCMCHIRRKLIQHNTSVLKNIRGYGYILDSEAA